MNEYWKKRNSELLKIHAQKADDIERELIKEYERSLNGIKKEIETFYARYAGENGISMAEARKQLSRDELKGFKLSLEEFREKALDNADGKWTTMLDNEYMRSRVSRLEALKYQMRGEVELLKQKQEDKFSTSLKKAYSDTYYTTNKHIADSVDYAVNFAKFDRDTVKNAIYEKWLDGSNFSDRIWNDKQKLLRELNTNLVHGITRGDSPDKMIKNISARMNVSKSRSAALYQTEYTHIMVDARLRSIMDAGCDEYEIDENMDSDICSECASMHGKHFKLSEYRQGITAPPFHTRCRGTITAYFADEEEIEHTMPEELPDKADNEISKSVDKSDASDIIKEDSNHFKELSLSDLDKFEKWQNDYYEYNKSIPFSREDNPYIYKYSGGSYEAINAIERGGESLERAKRCFGDLKEYIGDGEKISEELSKFKLNTPLKLKRCVGNVDYITGATSSVEDMKKCIGKTYLEKGFTSTSICSDTMLPFGGFDNPTKTTIEIYAPKATRGAYIYKISDSPAEFEFLIDRNTEYRILDAGERTVSVKDYKGNVKEKVERFIKMEVLTDV